jgi:hypothetical protein
MFFVSVASKEFNFTVSCLFATLAGMSISVAAEGLMSEGSPMIVDPGAERKVVGPHTPRAFVWLSKEKGCRRGHL